MMALASLVNGSCFFFASRSVMERGIEGVDDQAGLIFIPMLWILAAAVLVVLNASTAVRGRALPGTHRISWRRTADRPSVIGRIGDACWLLMSCGLAVFAYGLFADGPSWAVSYALTGGLLLVLLRVWERNIRVVRGGR